MVSHDFFSIMFNPLALQSGLICLGAHVIFYIFFAHILPDGPWKKLPSFTAHKAVCLPLMAFLSYNGGVAWFLENESSWPDDDIGANERIFALRSRGSDIASVVFGMMLFWDIPMSLTTKALRDVLMLVHHVGMVFVAGIIMGLFSGGTPIGSYYSPFFLGVIEFSSIFLCIVDIFHPKHKYWFEWLKENSGGAGGDEEKKSFLFIVNDLSRMIFAISFLALRTVYFPYVMFTTCLADFWRAGNLPSLEERHGASRVSLLTLCFVATLFTFLQIYWGLLIGKQVIKAVAASPGKEGDGRTKTD